MTTTATPDVSGNIVVGVDPSPSSELAVTWAAEEARAQHRGLTLVHAMARLSTNQLAALGTAGIPPAQIDEESRAEAERTMERVLSLAVASAPEAEIQTLIEVGDARSLLLELASTAAMVVVGSRGHGPVAGLLLGSVSGALVRHSGTPVAVIRARAGSAHGVLAAADGSDASVGPLEQAFREASFHRMPLTIMHCLWDGVAAEAGWVLVADADPEGEEARLRIAESMSGVADKFPEVEVRIAVTRGAIDACLVDLSADYDLLVIGRPPRSLGQRLLLSGVTTSVAEHAQSPVLVVP
jgi:nucleotide-binding universal stress UspA family protein